MILIYWLINWTNSKVRHVHSTGCTRNLREHSRFNISVSINSFADTGHGRTQCLVQIITKFFKKRKGDIFIMWLSFQSVCCSSNAVMHLSLAFLGVYPQNTSGHGNLFSGWNKRLLKPRNMGIKCRTTWERERETPENTFCYLEAVCKGSFREICARGIGYLGLRTQFFLVWTYICYCARPIWQAKSICCVQKLPCDCGIVLTSFRQILWWYASGVWCLLPKMTTTPLPCGEK